MRINVSPQVWSAVFFCIVVSQICAEEPLWVPETSFLHIERRLQDVYGATFSADEKYIEVQAMSSTGHEMPEIRESIRYDANSGEEIGIVPRASYPAWPKNFVAAHVFGSKFSDRERFITGRTINILNPGQTIETFHLFNLDGKALFKFPCERNDAFWFYQNDDLLVISYNKGYHVYSTKTGAATLDIDLGYKPEFVGLSKGGGYLYSNSPLDAYGKWTITSELVSVQTGKRLGPFKGSINNFSHDDGFFTVLNRDYAHIYKDLQGKNILELKKLPSCETIATLDDAISAVFTTNNNYALILEYKDDKCGLAAWDIRNSRRVWSSSVINAPVLFGPIVGQDKVVYVQDKAGNTKIVDIESGDTLLNFRDWRTRPEFAHLDLKKNGVHIFT